MRSFHLWWAESPLPNAPGLYCIWACYPRYDVYRGQYLEPSRLLYIGESGNLAKRLLNHEKEWAWYAQLTAGQLLAVTYARMDGEHESWRRSVENALIVHHQPPCNYDDLTFNWKQGVDVYSEGKRIWLASRVRCGGVTRSA